MAEELNALVGNAFRMAFASQLCAAATHSPHNNWNKEVGATNMGIRAPTSIPGLRHHYPHNYPTPHSLTDKCDLTSNTNPLVESASPSSSEESNSPTELNCYRRLADKPPLMKRLAMGLSGALMLQASSGLNDDSTPLVPDTPTSPTNRPVSVNGGYVNEAITECEVKSSIKEATRDRNLRDNSPSKTMIPLKHIHIDSINLNNQLRIIDKTLPANFDSDFVKKNNNNVKNSLQPFRTTRSLNSTTGAASTGANINSNQTFDLRPKEETELRLAPWFQAGIPREIALEVLANQPIGAFMVRSSTTKLGCFALSLRVPRDFQPSGIAHYLILRTTKGYKIKGFTKEFTSLTSLITHHSVMPELLPCPLSLSRYNPSYSRTDSNRDFEDIDNDPDYNTLADFRKMMADLNV